MEKNKNREEMAALLRSLSSADRAWLRQRLMRRDSAALLQDTGRISPRELLAVETWLWERASAARGPREKTAPPAHVAHLYAAALCGPAASGNF